MNKLLKYGLLIAGGVAVLVAGSAVYIAATFNPDDYKAQIAQLVKDKTQRTLKLDGDIKLSFFSSNGYPCIGADVGHASLSEPDSEKEFAAINSAHASLALKPLLSRQLVVEEVFVSGLHLSLVKFKDGKTNIDDLLGNPGDSRFKFDFAAVRIEKSSLVYLEESSGAHYALQDIKLNTGRIANGLPTKIDFTAALHANQPELNLATQLKTTLTFDLDKQTYSVASMDLQAKGATPAFSNLALRASGDASANFGTREFFAKNLTVSVTGIKGKNNFEARLDAPALNMTKDRFSADMIALELELKRPEKTSPLSDIKANLSSPVDGDLKSQQFNFPNLTLAVVDVGGKQADSGMKGSVQVDIARQSMQAKLAGGLLQSRIKANVAVSGFFNPAIRFDADVDHFDADLFFPKKAAANTAKATATERPLDLSALRGLNLEGSLRIGALKVGNVKSSQVRLDMKSGSGALFTPPH
jgi:AsmA protein